MTSRPVSQPETGRIGQYALRALIGEGGMGVVHLAEGPQGERVALKVLRPHVVGDDEGRSRLAREVSSLRRVRSPRVAEVYDADPWGEQPYLVTRYVDGPSLHERVRERGALSGDELRAIAVGLVQAVIAVHEGGVLHRDIKPSNVLIEREHDPVLIDFGLAKVAEDSRLTATGWLMGTPGYLAPEVLYGEQATPAADVHAWAATVAFAATGQSPFGRGPSMAVMDRARRGEHDLSGVPEFLRPLLAECLAPNPADRPRAEDVLDRLTSGRTAPRRQPPPPAADVSSTRPITVAQPYPPRPPLQRPSAPRSRPAPAAPHTPPRPRPALRTLLMVGLLLLFAFAVALAPYVAAATTFLLAWLVRTVSWSSDAMTDRRALKGNRKSDGFVRAVTAPWHLLVAVAGSVVLLLAAAATVAVPAVVLMALGVPEPQALFAGGLVGGLVLWWGPGSRRLRRPTRRVIWHGTRVGGSGEVWTGVVYGGAVVLLVAVATTGVLWWPDDGPPFDPSVLLPPGF